MCTANKPPSFHPQAPTSHILSSARRNATLELKSSLSLSLPFTLYGASDAQHFCPDIFAATHNCRQLPAIDEHECSHRNDAILWPRLTLLIRAHRFRCCWCCFCRRSLSQFSTSLPVQQSGRVGRPPSNISTSISKSSNKHITSSQRDSVHTKPAPQRHLTIVPSTYTT